MENRHEASSKSNDILLLLHANIPNGTKYDGKASQPWRQTNKRASYVITTLRRQAQQVLDLPHLIGECTQLAQITELRLRSTVALSFSHVWELWPVIGPLVWGISESKNLRKSSHQILLSNPPQSTFTQQGVPSTALGDTWQIRVGEWGVMSTDLTEEGADIPRKCWE